MLDVSGGRIEDVEARVGGSDPHALARVHQHHVHRIAGEGAGIGGVVAVDAEAVGRAVPACEPAILDREPQVVVCVLDYGLDVVARQTPMGTA